jgi:hypothetical protein
MKSGRTQVEIIALYEELGSYRAVGALLGCDHKTVKRYVQAAGEAGQLAPALQRARVTDDFAGLIAGRVEQSGGRVTGRRLMRIMRASGYEGSERSLRRALAEAKAAWRARQALEGRVYRPWVSEPGEWMLCDWGAAGTVPTRADPVDQRHELGAVVAMPAGQADRKRNAVRVGDQGGFEPDRARSTGEGPVWSPKSARIWLPSTTDVDQSIRPAAFS